MADLTVKALEALPPGSGVFDREGVLWVSMLEEESWDTPATWITWTTFAEQPGLLGYGDDPERFIAQRGPLRLAVPLPEGGDAAPTGEAQSGSKPLGLDHLMDDVWAWHRRELGEGTVIGKVAKVAEEAGELVGHTIKSTEPRADAAAHRQKAIVELADVVIAVCGAAKGLDVESLDSVVREKWAVVRERQFTSAVSLPEGGEQH